MKPEFQCPIGMRRDLADVLRGEYDIPKLTFDKPPVVLDCGGNVGAFAVRARHKWPHCKVIAYEPHPDTARVFRANCPDVELHEVALVENKVSDGETIRLFCGINCGTNSLYNVGQQNDGIYWDVKAMWAGDLPPCDFLKIDTEGAELPILRGYQHLKTVSGVALEFHREGDPWEIGQILSDAGLSCAAFLFWPTKNGGWMKWRRVPAGERTL